MIKLYISNNRSSRYAIQFFNDNHIPYVKISLNSTFTKKDLLYILSRNEEDVQNILALRSPKIKNIKHELEQLTLNNLMNMILSNKSILKTPIIIDDKHFLCGYNKEDIRSFLPRQHQI